MGKRSFFVYLYLLVTYITFGEGAYTFSLGIETGFLYGTSYEITYTEPQNEDYVSELAWDLKPLWFVGLTAEYGPREPLKGIAVFTNLNFKAGIPAKTGVIEDRDWLTPTTEQGSLTLFSSHDNRTKTVLLADLEGGISIPVKGPVVLKLLFDISYMLFKFEAWDGYSQYGANGHFPTVSNPYVPWDANWPKKKLKGLGIDYMQNWLIFSPGLEAALLFDYVSISVLCFASPFVFCFASDNHYQQTPAFYTTETLNGGACYEAEGKITLSLNRHFAFNVRVSYRYITGTRGDLELSEQDSSGTTSTYYKDIAGAGARFLTGTLGFVYSF
ncbi:MAG: omptin family outer membrane protease [Spirochaetaceae bacterium]|jgi:outer membrane protease|nr:omptin family outer membrane protease [Spirochaetaceae bacterium]